MAVTKALFAGDDPTPDSVKRRRMMADMLLAQGQDIRHVDSPLEAIGSLLQSGVGAYQSRKADQEDKAGLASRRQGQNMLLDSAFGAGAGFGSATGPIGSSSETPQGRMAAASIPAGERASYIRSGLIQRGLPEHVADGFLVNFQDESGLDPGINEKAPLVPGSRGGFGLYQLTGPRRRDYEAFASQRGVDPSDVDAQMDFLVGEMGVGNAGSQNAPWWGSERAAAMSILAAPDTSTAAQAIVNNFLRPAPEHRASRTRRYAGLGGSAAPVQVASLDPSAGVAEATAPQASSGPLDTRAIVERAMADQKAREGGPVAEFGAQDVPALTPGNRLGDTLSPEDQAIYDARIRGRGPQPNGQPYTGPGARTRDADAMTSIAPVGLPGSSAAANAGIEAFHAGNGSTPVQYGQGVPGVVPPSPTSDLRGVLTQAVEAQEQAAVPAPAPPQAAQSMAGAPSTALVPGGDGKGPVDPAALSNSPLVRGGALPSSADPMLGGNEGALAMARQSQGGAAGAMAMPAQPQASAGGYATELPSPPPPPIQSNQQRAALAAALTGGQGQAPGGLPYNRAMIAQLLANPYTEDLGQAALQEVLRYRAQANKPVEYDYQSMPDGTLLRLDPRGGAPQVAYQGQQRPIEVNGRLVDPSTGRVVADFSDRNTATVGGAVVDLDTGQPIYQAPQDPISLPQGNVLVGPDGRRLAENPKAPDAPSGYRVTPNGLEAIPGGPADPRAPAAPKPGSGFENEQGLRKEYTAAPEVKEYADVRSSYERLRASASTGSGPGDLGVIFGYMKMLDPGSVVREGEFATAEQAQGVPERVLNLYNKLLTGERLTPDQRRSFVDAAGNLYGQVEAKVRGVNERYGQIAQQYGIDPSRVIQTLPTYEPLKLDDAASTPPPVVTQPSGQRFEGGVPVGGASQPAVQRARNPKTGEILELRDGGWVVAQ